MATIPKEIKEADAAMLFNAGHTPDYVEGYLAGKEHSSDFVTCPRCSDVRRAAQSEWERGGQGSVMHVGDNHVEPSPKKKRK